MKNDTKTALNLLNTGNFTCVVCFGEICYRSTVRGVKPLLEWLDNGPSLKNFCAADRVVGRAAAFLYCLLGVSEVYAQVMSRPAADVLNAHGIHVEAGLFTDGIINRKGTGPCPFESAVLHIQDPSEALKTIRHKIATM